MQGELKQKKMSRSVYSLSSPPPLCLIGRLYIPAIKKRKSSSFYRLTVLNSGNFISSHWRINPHLTLKKPQGLKGTIVNRASIYSTLFCGPST